MKYYDLHTWKDLKPDEKEFKESIIEFLCDHFCHEDLHIMYTHDTQNLPVYGKNVVVFLTGNEPSITPSYYDKVGIIYTDFWLPTMPNNVKNVPLGFNERTSGRFINVEKIKLISEREIDVCFIGSDHSKYSTSNHRRSMLDAVSKLDSKIRKEIITYNTFFYEKSENKSDQIQKYFNITSNSKIVLCPGGNMSKGDSDYFSGWESYRFREAISLGNIILCNYDWSDWYKAPNVFCIKKWEYLNTNIILDILSLDLDKIQKNGILYYKEKISRFNILKSIIHDIQNILK